MGTRRASTTTLASLLLLTRLVLQWIAVKMRATFVRTPTSALSCEAFAAGRAWGQSCAINGRRQQPEISVRAWALYARSCRRSRIRQQIRKNTEDKKAEHKAGKERLQEGLNALLAEMESIQEPDKTYQHQGMQADDQK